MDKVSLALSSIMGIAFVMLLAPGILAMNRGKTLRNIALWLGIFAALGLAYRIVGPGRNDLIEMTTENGKHSDNASDRSGADNKPDTNKDTDQGYFPPKED